MTDDAIKAEIAAELNKALETLGAGPELLSAVGSYGDTLRDEQVLAHLKSLNETGSIFEEVICRAVAPKGPDRFRIDPYLDGFCVYRLDSEGEISSIDAWSRNALVARAAFDALVLQYPKDSFSLRNRSRVIDEKIAGD
jgi:hypothetical protein